MGLREVEELGLGKWLDLEQKILNAKINGRSFAELTAHRGVALWWFIRFRLYHSARTNPLINSLIKNTFFFSFADFLYDFFTYILCRVFSRYSEIKVGKKQQLKILITGQNRQWGNVRTLSGRLKKGDAFFDSVITCYA